MTWTLLLLVMITGTQPTQLAVSGFSSQAACVNAAQGYLTQLQKQTQPEVIYRSACVPMGDLK